MLAGTGQTFATQSEPPGRTAQIAVPTNDPYMALFAVALTAIKHGDYATAISMLKGLYRDRPTPRIRLELARAYYLDRQYALAREQFEKVLDQPELPWGVRQNVDRYLERIEDSLGKVSLSFSLISDSNPLNLTDHRQINIFGTTQTLTPPSNSGEIWGMQIQVNATRAFTDDATLVSFTNIAFKNFEGSALDRWTINSGVAWAPRATPKWRGKLGLEYVFLDGHTHYRLPYISATYFPDPIYEFKLSGEFRLSYLDVPRYDYLDAHIQTLDLKALYTFSDGSQMLGRTYLEHTLTEDAAYENWGTGFSLDYTMPVYGSWKLTTAGSLGFRTYQDTDPLFLERREDLTKKARFTLSNKNWKIFGTTPEFGVAYERTDSSIDYYSYDKISLILSTKGS